MSRKIRHMDDIEKTITAAEIMMRLLRDTNCPSCTLMVLSEAISIVGSMLITDEDFDSEITADHILTLVAGMLEDQIEIVKEFKTKFGKDIKKEKDREQQSHTCFAQSRKTH